MHKSSKIGVSLECVSRQACMRMVAAGKHAEHGYSDARGRTHGGYSPCSKRKSSA